MKALLAGLFTAVIALFFLIRRSRLNMKITENFRLGEFVATSTGLYNYPDEEVIKKIVFTAKNVAQPLRDRFGALKITSGYRSRAVNEKVGGVENSRHKTGEAFDVVPVDISIDELYEGMQKLNLPIKKVLYSVTGKTKWLHVEPDFSGKEVATLYLKDDEVGAGYDFG